VNISNHRIYCGYNADDLALMKGYIHDLPGWPAFHWNANRLTVPLSNLRFQQGRLWGKAEVLGFQVQQDEIVGDATSRYHQPLTEERLSDWHRLLFREIPGDMRTPRTRTWRDGGAGPKHPAAHRLSREMSRFIEWFNRDHDRTLDAVLKAGIAHLGFVTIHPFDDGNGRMANAIAEMALCRSARSPLRFYSLSQQVVRERARYAAQLEQTQRGTLDVTQWLSWFIGCVDRAIEHSLAALERSTTNAQVFQLVSGTALNDRQRLVLNRLVEGFDGHLTTSKWAAIARCSTDSALRDITDLVERQVLAKNTSRGRSTSYTLLARVR
jgi:Fic family protein